MLSGEEKNQKPEQFHLKAFEVIRYNRNHGEIITFGMKTSRDNANKDFILTFKAVTVIGCLCFQFIVNGKS